MTNPLSVQFSLAGDRELMKSINRVGNIPQSVLRQAVMKAARIVSRDAKQEAPYDTGELRANLKLKEEKNIKSGKGYKGFQVYPYGQNFIKYSKTGKRSFYPASQEFGFKTRLLVKNSNKNTNGRKSLSWVPGFHYLRTSGIRTEPIFRRVVLSEISKKIDKDWRGN